MHSRARLTYTEVWSWLSDAGDREDRGGEGAAAAPRRACTRCTNRSPRRASKRGAIDFDTAELAIQFDEHGKITAIVPAPRNDAHKLIEECMLAANVCAADFLTERKQMTLFRVHEPPAAGQARRAARIPRDLGAAPVGRREADAPPITRSFSTARATAPTSICCRRCCCARCRRRSTARTTRAISALRTRRMRISRRRSAATPISSCTARSSPRSPAARTRPRA